MSKKSFYSFVIITSCITLQSVFAFQPKETQRYFNGPTVTSVTAHSAQASLSQSIVNDLTEYEKQGGYFEYRETNQVCIAIYPTPEVCLPKKTQAGSTTVQLINLKSKTSYTVVYKRDNTIRCITTPCPMNDFESLSVEFVTTEGTVTTPTPSTTLYVTKNLAYKSRGTQVVLLQRILIEKGHLETEATGYFGVMTLKAVKDFQRANNIVPTGFVGPLTRAALMRTPVNLPISKGETFEGTITAFSTACFADGECSVTVDGKRVITTIGWSQQIVGKVLGVSDFGAIESKIGSRAKVYAEKVGNDYTLYGSSDYYIQVQ